MRKPIPKTKSGASEATAQKLSQRQVIDRVEESAVNSVATLRDGVTGEEVNVPVQELAALKDFFSEKVPLFKGVQGSNKLYLDHPSQAVAQAMVAKAMGITGQAFYHGAISQLVNAVSTGSGVNVNDLNVAVAMVQGIGPRDQLETMLALQMVAVHMASMSFMRKMNHTETIPQLDLQERVVNKLMRTFTTQMEALRKHRNGGTQKVIVKHVYVGEGGQAIIGNVSHGGRPLPERAIQSHEHESLSISVIAALHGDVEADEVPVSGSGGAK